MLERRPLRLHEVAGGLEQQGLIGVGQGFDGAQTTLERLTHARLVRRRHMAREGDRFGLTRRGRGELRLQRMLWRRTTAITPCPDTAGNTVRGANAC